MQEPIGALMKKQSLIATVCRPVALAVPFDAVGKDNGRVGDSMSFSRTSCVPGLNDDRDLSLNKDSI